MGENDPAGLQIPPPGAARTGKNPVSKAQRIIMCLYFAVLKKHWAKQKISLPDQYSIDQNVPASYRVSVLYVAIPVVLKPNFL